MNRWTRRRSQSGRWWGWLEVRKDQEEEEAVVEGVRKAGPFSVSRTLVSHSVVARFRSSILRRRCPWPIILLSRLRRATLTVAWRPWTRSRFWKSIDVVFLWWTVVFATVLNSRSDISYQLRTVRQSFLKWLVNQCWYLNTSTVLRLEYV